MTSTPSFIPEFNVTVVEVRRSINVDSDVIPAALQYIIDTSHKKQATSPSATPRLALISTDSHPKNYKTLCNALRVPSSQVLDGFSEWYSMPEGESPKPPGKKVHTAELSSHSKLVQLAGCVANRLNTIIDSQDQPAFVVLDSLSSVLQFSSRPDTVFRLRDLFLDAILADKTKAPKTTNLIYTLHSEQVDRASRDAALQLADTYIDLFQEGEAQKARDTVRMKIRRCKPSGRVQFEEVKARMAWDTLQLVDITVIRDLDGSLGKQGKPPESEEELAETLAQHGLSFRVTLSSKEREMRAAAGLPYLHKDEELADSALELHPAHLQIGKNGSEQANGDSEEASDSEDEELFSEDV